MKKSLVILSIYTYLLDNKKLETSKIESEFGISNRTCIRYIKDIKEFINNNKPEYSLVYKRSLNAFVLLEKNK